jgi:ferric-dicitrate binding protein FerR (iron transport regulator)
MNRLTCLEVEVQIELFALNECPRPLQQAMAAHVASCPSCQGSLREARLLLGLLDLEYQESERLERLFDRLDAERRPVRRRTPQWPRQLAALAALVLIALGLTWWTPTGPETIIEPIAPGRMELAQAVPGGPKRSLPQATIWLSSSESGRTVTEGVQLSAGSLRVRVHPGAAFTVRTPRGWVVSSDGLFRVEIGRTADQVTVLEGHVELSNKHGIGKGQTGDVWSLGEATPPRRERGRRGLRGRRLKFGKDVR